MSNLIPRIEFLFQALCTSQKICPHCHSLNADVVCKKYQVIKIKKCQDCLLYFTSPIYRSLLGVRFYDLLYRGEGCVTTLPAINADQNFSEDLMKRLGRDFSHILRALSGLTEGSRLLEVGSSWGYFLFQAKKYGFDPVGIEIADKRRRFGIDKLGVNIVKSFDELGNQRFDVIYSSHTLEHFTDISMFFRDAFNHLKSKGKLLIEVPNIDFENEYERSLLAMGAVHPLGFNVEFFEKNMPKYGFLVIGVYNTQMDFPARPSKICSSDGLMVMMEKNA